MFFGLRVVFDLGLIFGLRIVSGLRCSFWMFFGFCGWFLGLRMVFELSGDF